MIGEEAKVNLTWKEICDIYKKKGGRFEPFKLIGMSRRVNADFKFEFQGSFGGKTKRRSG